MPKFTQSQLARVWKKQHYSQSLPCGELWTFLRLALAHTVTEICTTSFVNLSNWLYADGAKIHAKSTCVCAKETTFFTISTSWWTLNCSPFSSSSYGYWVMHHFICQFYHTDCMLKVLLIFLVWKYTCRFDIDNSITALLSNVSCSTSSYLVILRCSYDDTPTSSCTDDDDVSITCTALETLVYKSIQCCKMRVYVMVYSSIQNHRVQLQFTGCRFITPGLQ